MTHRFEPLTALNKFARLLVGLRPPRVVNLPSVMLAPVELEEVEPKVELAEEAAALNLFRSLVVTIGTLRSNELHLTVPDEYQLRETVFLDIPGLPQFPADLLFRPLGQHKVEIGFPAEQGQTLAPVTVPNWPKMVVEDAAHFLPAEEQPWLPKPEMGVLKDEPILVLPDQLAPDFALVSPHLSGFTTTLIRVWPPVIIKDMFKVLTRTGNTGKNYDTGQPQQVEGRPPEVKPRASKRRCIHGLTKATCDICAQQNTRRTRDTGKGKPRVVNPFDLLLPFLYPPLGTNFDNTLIFPPGKDLYDFQRDGIRFLATHRAALLGDEMGLGKSIQAIFAIRLLFRSSKRPMNVLILCPKSVLKDWEKKLQEWAPELRTTVIAGNQQFRLAMWETSTHVYLTSYDMLARDIAELPSRYFTIAILDEAQSIKSPTTKRTKAVRQVEAEWRWGLSGTPLENRVEELISIFAYLKPRLLTYEDAGNTALVKDKINDYFLRRTMEKVREKLNLGDKIYREVWLELTPAQKKTYDRIAAEARATLKPLARRYQVSEIEVRGKTLVEIHRLKQICNLDPATGQSCKADYLLEKLEEIQAVNEKALVFSQYPHVSLKPLAQRFKAFKLQFFDGSLSNKQRDTLIEQFQMSDEAGIMLMSVKAGGVGITLTRANHVFFLDQWWNPAVGRQAEGRAYRIGQDKTVFVTSFCVANTIEERIRQILEYKEQLFREVIDDRGDEVVKSITTEELLELFDLVVFDVQLLKPGREIAKTIQVVGEITGLDYNKARRLVLQLPAMVLKGVPRKAANQATKRIEASGATAKIQSRPAD